MSKLGPISHFLSPVSCDSLVLQGLRWEWGAGVLNFVLSLSLSHTGHWKFNMAHHGKELSENLKKIIISLHKDGIWRWPRHWNRAAARWPRPYSGLTGQVPLRKASPWSTKEVECTCSVCCSLQQCWQHSYIYFPNTTCKLFAGFLVHHL